MSKSRLDTELIFDFTLLGLIAPVKEFKMAWLINEAAGVNLVKKEDIRIDFVKGEAINICNYGYEDEFSYLRLLRNKAYDGNRPGQGYLLPELSEFDFFVQVNGFENGIGMDGELKKILRGIGKVQYVQDIKIASLKSKENLIF